MFRIYFEEDFDDFEDFDYKEENAWGDGCTPLSEIDFLVKEADQAWREKNYDQAINLYQEAEKKYSASLESFKGKDDQIIQKIAQITRKIKALNRSKKRAEIMKKTNEKLKEEVYQETLNSLKTDLRRKIIREAKKAALKESALPLEIKKEKFISEILFQDKGLMQTLRDKGLKPEEVSAGLRLTVEIFANLDKELTKILSKN